VIATPRVSAATPDDLRELGSLREEQGWQRNEALLGAIIAWEHGRIFVVRESELGAAHTSPHASPHAIVATTTAIAAGPVGAIGNVIVRSDARRRGLARLIVSTALDWMRTCGVLYAHLDATKDGRPLYRSLGFVEVTPSWFAHAPLPDTPEETWLVRIESEFHSPVRGKRSKAGPFALDRLDWPVDRLFEAVDGHRDVHFLRRRIAGIDGRFVERADPDAIVALSLEIEAFVEVGDEGEIPESRSPDP